jgi:hypothetical protein
MPATSPSNAGLLASPVHNRPWAGPTSSPCSRSVSTDSQSPRVIKFAQGNQVPSPLVPARCQNMQEQPLDHRPRGFIPERIVRAALMDDDKGVSYAPRLVDGFLVFRIQGVERIEPAPHAVIHLRRQERIENHDLLAYARGVWRPPVPSCGRDRRVFALGIDDTDRTRPCDQRRDDPGRALAAPRSPDKADMAVVPVAEGNLVFTGRAPQPDHAVAVQVSLLDLIGIRPLRCGKLHRHNGDIQPYDGMHEWTNARRF